MKRRLIILAVVILVLPIVVLCAILLALATPPVQSLIAGEASRALGRPVSFASLSVVPVPVPRLRVRGIEIAEDPHFATGPWLRIDQADVQLRVARLLHGHVELESIVLQRPAVTVIRDADGRLNVTSLGEAAKAAHPTRSTDEVATHGVGAESAVLFGARVLVEDGNVTYIRRRTDGSAPPLQLGDVDLTLTFGPEVSFRGDGRLQPSNVVVTIINGRAVLNGVNSLREATVGAGLSLDGEDVTDFFAALLGPTPGIGGAIEATLRVGGTLGAPTVQGPLTLSNASVTMAPERCPEPRDRTLVISSLGATAEWNGNHLSGRPTTAQIGGGRVSTNLSVTFGANVAIEFDDIAVHALPLETVLVDFLCGGYAVTGPLNLTGYLAIRPGASPHPLSAYGRLQVGEGKVVGPHALALLSAVLRVGGAVSALLSADLPRALVSSPFDIDWLTATYDVSNGVLTITDLLYNNRAMTIAGAGTYQLTAGETDMDMIVNHGRGLAHVKITGPADSPHVRVVPSTILRDIDPGSIGRGLHALLQRLR